MFSFRFDKAGFFSGLTLMILLGGTVLATILIFVIGGWNDTTILVWKWIVGTVWVLCIITVLVRVAIYRYQMRGVNPHKRDGGPLQNPNGPDVQLPPDASDRRDEPPRQNPEEPDGQRPPETSEMSRERESS